MKKNLFSLEGCPKIKIPTGESGILFPGFISNRQSFALANLQLYDDRVIDCWERGDLEIIRDYLMRGRITPFLGEEAQFYVHELGCWTIRNGDWNFNTDKYYEVIRGIINELSQAKKSSGFKSVFQLKERFFQKNKSLFRNGKPYFFDGFTSFSGEVFRVFMKVGTMSFQLVNLVVYPGSRIQIFSQRNNKIISLKDFIQMVEDKSIQTDVLEGSRVLIPHLGSFEIDESTKAVKLVEKVKDIKDIASQLDGGQNSLEICRNYFNEYFENPSKRVKELLKESYENIPDYKRNYVLSNMDTKDIPIRMIIYGEQEIENWSSYRTAKAKGRELPKIFVPKIND